MEHVADGTNYIVAGLDKIPVTIIHSTKRRTISVIVKQTGDVVVRAPASVTSKKALEVAQSHAEWVVKHKQAVEKRARPEERKYETGDTIPFFGMTWTIERHVGEKVTAELKGDVLHLTAPREHANPETFQEVVSLFYRRHAIKYLQPIVNEVSARAGVTPPKLRLHEQKRKWGSCTPKNGIIINARLLLAPPKVLYYVVVHEIAHINHRHHQDSFWKEVERLMPDYREAERIIKEQGRMWVF